MKQVLFWVLCSTGGQCLGSKLWLMESICNVSLHPWPKHYEVFVIWADFSLWRSLNSYHEKEEKGEGGEGEGGEGGRWRRKSSRRKTRKSKRERRANDVCGVEDHIKVKSESFLEAIKSGGDMVMLPSVSCPLPSIIYLLRQFLPYSLHVFLLLHRRYFSSFYPAHDTDLRNSRIHCHDWFNMKDSSSTKW